MIKTLESLSTLHRFLILVAATLLITALTARTDPLSMNHALQRLTQVERQHRFLRTELARRTNDHYKSQFRTAASGAPEWQRRMIETMSIMPLLVTINDTSHLGDWTLALPSDTVRVGELLALPVMHDAQASYPLFTFSQTDLTARLSDIAKDRRTLYEATDLTVFVGPPPPNSDQCSLGFRSALREQQDEPPWLWLATCTPAVEPGNGSDMIKGLFELSDQLDHTSIEVPQELGWLPYPLGREQLSLLAVREAQRAETDIDIAGPKLSGQAWLGIGPILVLALLLLMLGHARSLRLAATETSNEALAWFGLFLGWPALVVMLASIVLLPTVAVTFAAVATYHPLPSLPKNLPWWSPALLWDQSWVIGSCLATLVLSLLILWTNFREARAWRDRVPSMNDGAKRQRRHLRRDRV